ncbi:unnamed protein product [Rhizophagus irregularis]|nr:unnamed protein product [Rhizophagus irregularis]CAB4409565.1 unnamed protein product [Rhizophagus irregularis]
MLINCAREDDPDVIFDYDYTCEDDEICVDRTEFPETSQSPHAFSNTSRLCDPISVNKVNNSTRVINGYNRENINFCFNGGTTTKVQAFAAAWISD